MSIRVSLITTASFHQLSLGAAFHDILGEDFHMIFTRPLSVDRVKMGWDDSTLKEPWILRAWESKKSEKRMRECIDFSDVVIYGAVPVDLVRDRIRSGKLTFRYSERLFKRGFLLGFPWWLRRLMRDFWPLNMPNHHLLAAGAYCGLDHRHARMFKNRMWQWGYFTDVPQDQPYPRAERFIKILWAGRMIDWKEVCLIIESARRLKPLFMNFSIDLIGDGPERKKLFALHKRYGLQDVIRFIPSMPPKGVREAMKRADIYIMTSNFREGWGAVVNEAMSEGCCVVSSNGPGAAPWLISHGKTGFLFKSGDVQGLFSILAELMPSPEICAQVGYYAWLNMNAEWSPEVAASRLVRLSEGLLGGTPIPKFRSGPCSKCG